MCHGTRRAHECVSLRVSCDAGVSARNRGDGDQMRRWWSFNRAGVECWSVAVALVSRIFTLQLIVFFSSLAPFKADRRDKERLCVRVIVLVHSFISSNTAALTSLL